MNFKQFINTMSSYKIFEDLTENIESKQEFFDIVNSIEEHITTNNFDVLENYQSFLFDSVNNFVKKEKDCLSKVEEYYRNIYNFIEKESEKKTIELFYLNELYEIGSYEKETTIDVLNMIDKVSEERNKFEDLSNTYKNILSIFIKYIRRVSVD
jgi:hypothetical protein